MDGDRSALPAMSDVADIGVGYRSGLYAESFLEFGEVVYLPRSRGWLLERRISGTDHIDATGLYPLFCCQNWSALEADLREQDRGWVSVTLVADPLGDFDNDVLRASFDVVHSFKEHYIADSSHTPESYVSRSHRQNARRALRKMEVAFCPEPLTYLDDWIETYRFLSAKHDITGVRAFSPEAFEKQLAAPGMVMFRASKNGATVGLDLWYVDGDTAQGHLAAFTDVGYRLAASYATKWTLINYFGDLGVRYVNLGGLPGVTSTEGSGLEHFKLGWTNTVRKSFICGKVLNPEVYHRLSANMPQTNFFPAYRSGDQ